MTSDWLWNLNSQKCPIYNKYVPPRNIFGSVLLYDKPFSRYEGSKIGKNQKCTDWSQNDPEHLTVKSTLHALSTYLEAQIVVSFALLPAVLQI